MIRNARDRDAESRNMAALYSKGATAREIGSRFGCSDYTVRRRLASIGVALRRRGPQGQRASWIRTAIRLRRAGATLDEIGARFGVSRQRVHQALSRHE